MLRVHRGPPRSHPVALGLVAGVIVGALVTLLVVFLTPGDQGGTTAEGRNEIASNGNVQGRIYPGDPEDEANLVQDENDRLLDVRSASTARRGTDSLIPFHLPTGDTSTLILPARSTPWSLNDLLTLAPDTLVLQPGGSYLLSENIVVLEGATLDLRAYPGLRISLVSTPKAFVSIVAIGGTLKIGGNRDTPAKISSLDTTTGLRDWTTDDGRAYVRVIGGHASLSHVDFSHLGFWSGNTGGLALTGTDGVEEIDSVTASIDNVTIDSDAFGLFVTRASNVTIRDSEIRNSLVDGLVFHRFVLDSSVVRTTSTGNAVDGFSLGRSSVDVEYTDITASDNGRNGLTLDGQPLADGPSAIGTPIDVYGDNTVTRAKLVDNKRYGIEVSGGRNITVDSSTFKGNDIGIVLSHGADDVVIAGGTFRAQTRQGIAVRDTVTRARITDADITGGETGVYVRNADATVTGSQITDVSRHGVTLVGDAAGVRVTGNSIAGYGPAALWTKDATGGVVEENDLLNWHPAPTVASVLQSFFQPLTIVWLLLGILLVATALTRKGGQYGSFRDPYAERVPLTSLSKGIVSRESIEDDK
jgi:nitrous oxidase accessory protein NosD